MKTGAAWLAGKLFDHASTSGTYSRQADSESIAMVRAETSARSMDQFGLGIDIRVADFLIKEDDLVLPLAGAIKPEKNDKIIFVVGDKTVTYEVLKLVTEDVYRESDRFGNTYRVHTKEIGRV